MLSVKISDTIFYEVIQESKGSIYTGGSYAFRLEKKAAATDISGKITWKLESDGVAPPGEQDTNEELDSNRDFSRYFYITTQQAFTLSASFTTTSKEQKTFTKKFLAYPQPTIRLGQDNGVFTPEITGFQDTTGMICQWSYKKSGASDFTDFTGSCSESRLPPELEIAEYAIKVAVTADHYDPIADTIAVFILEAAGIKLHTDSSAISKEKSAILTVIPSNSLDLTAATFSWFYKKDGIGEELPVAGCGAISCDFPPQGDDPVGTSYEVIARTTVDGASYDDSLELEYRKRINAKLTINGESAVRAFYFFAKPGTLTIPAYYFPSGAKSRATVTPKEFTSLILNYEDGADFSSACKENGDACDNLSGTEVSLNKGDVLLFGTGDERLTVSVLSTLDEGVGILEFEDLKKIEGVDKDEGAATMRRNYYQLHHLTGNAAAWISIGVYDVNAHSNSHALFGGSYDGQGLSLIIKGASESISKYAGLFWKIAGTESEPAIIRNLDVDLEVNWGCEQSCINLGALAHDAKYLKLSKLTGSVKVKCKDTANVCYPIGGLVGQATGPLTFEALKLTVNVKGRNPSGGLVGNTSAAAPLDIKTSQIEGTVVGTYNIGGLLGKAQGELKVVATEIAVAVEGQSDIGGTVGSISSTEQVIFQANLWTGSVTGSNGMGGTIGKLEVDTEKERLLEKNDFKGTLSITNPKNHYISGGAIGLLQKGTVLLRGNRFQTAIKDGVIVGGAIGQVNAEGLAKLSFNAFRGEATCIQKYNSKIGPVIGLIEEGSSGNSIASSYVKEAVLACASESSGPHSPDAVTQSNMFSAVTSSVEDIKTMLTALPNTLWVEDSTHPEAPLPRLEWMLEGWKAKLDSNAEQERCLWVSVPQTKEIEAVSYSYREPQLGWQVTDYDEENCVVLE